MAKLTGAQPTVLQKILDLGQISSEPVTDEQIAHATKISSGEVQDWLRTLGESGYVNLVKTSEGLSASITPTGRLELGPYLEAPRASPPASKTTADQSIGNDRPNPNNANTPANDTLTDRVGIKHKLKWSFAGVAIGTLLGSILTLSVLPAVVAYQRRGLAPIFFDQLFGARSLTSQSGKADELGQVKTHAGKLNPAQDSMKGQSHAPTKDLQSASKTTPGNAGEAKTPQSPRVQAPEKGVTAEQEVEALLCSSSRADWQFDFAEFCRSRIADKKNNLTVKQLKDKYENCRVFWWGTVQSIKTSDLKYPRASGVHANRNRIVPPSEENIR
jgi:hypothetical protein